MMMMTTTRRCMLSWVVVLLAVLSGTSVHAVAIRKRKKIESVQNPIVQEEDVEIDIEEEYDPAKDRKPESCNGGPVARCEPGTERFQFPMSESPVFECVMLGTRGGVTEDNLSSYMITMAGGENYILMDGGSFNPGLRKAKKYKSVTEGEHDDDVGKLWHTDLKAVFIGHTHLDHLAGVLVAMTENFMDRELKMYAQKWTLTNFKESVFNDVLWPKALANSNNGGDGGMQEAAKYPETVDIDVGNDGEKLKVGALPICHGLPATGGENCFESAAFIVMDNDKANALVYLSDVGPFRRERLGDKCVPAYREAKISAVTEVGVDKMFPAALDAADGEDSSGFLAWGKNNNGPCASLAQAACGTSETCVWSEKVDVTEYNPDLNGYWFNPNAKVDKVLDEHESRMFNLLRVLARDFLCKPDKSLRAVFMEVAYPEGKADPVFGHLTPSTYMSRVRQLGNLAIKMCGGEDGHLDGKDPLDGVTFVLTHMKPYFDAGYVMHRNIDPETGVLKQEGTKEVDVMQASKIQFEISYNMHCNGGGAEKRACRGVKFLVPDQGSRVGF